MQRRDTDATDGVSSFLSAAAESVGARNVSSAAEVLRGYGENSLATGDRVPAGVIFPGSTEEVRSLVLAANQFGAELWPISTGNNQGLGTRSPVRAGQVVLDLGRRMNRILEIDDTLGFAVVEPGVSYQRMYDELVRRGNGLMLDTISGPPQAGIIGNTLDRGAGYTPYFDHSYMSCGFEAVLGNGDVIRTGDGALPNSKSWHVSKYTFGPDLAGLFTQSNLGIVTRMGFWLMPRPPVIQSFHFAFPDDEDLAEIIELCRPLKLTNFVPTLFRVASDVWLYGSEETNPEYEASRGLNPLSEGGRKELQLKHGIGAWVVSGAFYGQSAEAIAPSLGRVRSHFTRSGRARYIPHDQALENPILRIAIDAFSGVPTSRELALLRWRPGGGSMWFLPGMPMTGKIAAQHYDLTKRVLSKFGFEYCALIVCGGRFAREIIVISFNREDDDERRRADAAYRALTEDFAIEGYGVGRAPHGYHAVHANLLAPNHRRLCSALKKALDPAAVIAPGKYGMDIEQ